MTTPEQLAADEAALTASQANERELFDALVSAQNAAMTAILAEEVAQATVVADGTPTPVVPPVVPPVVTPVVTPPTTTVTVYPKRTDTRGFVPDPATQVITPTGGVQNVTGDMTISNTRFVGGLNHTGGTITLENVQVEGGHGWDGYLRSNGTIKAHKFTSARTGDSGLGSSVSHNIFAGNGAHSIVDFDLSGGQTGISLGGGPDNTHPCYVANGKVHQLRQIGSGHCESQFVSITGNGYFLTEYCHLEPGGHTGWQTAAVFMQPASGECWFTLRHNFIAGQNISLYIQSAYKQTASAWAPAPPPNGHPGHLYCTDNDWGPQTSPNASWNTWWKSAFGDFAAWSNNREVDVNYQPTGFVIAGGTSWVDSDSGSQRKPASRVD